MQVTPAGRPLATIGEEPLLVLECAAAHILDSRWRKPSPLELMDDRIKQRHVRALTCLPCNHTCARCGLRDELRHFFRHFEGSQPNVGPHCSKELRWLRPGIEHPTQRARDDTCNNALPTCMNRRNLTAARIRYENGDTVGGADCAGGISASRDDRIRVLRLNIVCAMLSHFDGFTAVNLLCIVELRHLDVEPTSSNANIGVHAVCGVSN